MNRQTVSATAMAMYRRVIGRTPRAHFVFVVGFVGMIVLWNAAAARATNGTWNVTSGTQLWSTATNWTGSIIATGTDGIADFSLLDLTSDDTVHLDTARTIGQLKFADTTPGFSWFLDNNGNASNVLTLAVAVGTPTITVINDRATISAMLAGTQGLTTVGGSLVLSGSNTFTGGVTISSVGTLQLGNAGALNSTTPNAVAFGAGANAFLDLFGFSATISGLSTNVSVGTPVVKNDGATLSTLTVNNSSANTYAGTVANGLSVLALAKSGAGTLTLSGSNTFTGGVTINAGTLQLGSNGALNVTGANVVTFGASSTGILSIAGNSVIISGLNTNATVGSPVVQNAGVPATLTVNNTAANTFGGVLQDGAGGGALSLVKSSPGTLVLSGSNTFTGGVTINGGTLQLGNSGALNSSLPNAVTFGASSTGILSLGVNSVTVSGVNSSAPLGTPIVQSASGQGTVLTVNNSGGNAYGGVLQDGGGGGFLALVKSGAGTLTLSGANAFTGGVTLNTGTLQMGSTGAMNTTTPNVVTFGAASTGILSLNGNNITVGGLITNNTIGTPVVQNANAAPVTLTVDCATTSSSFAGVLQNGAGGGTLALAKSGSGPLLLSGANTFTGGVTINAGALLAFSAGALNSTTPNAVTFGPNSTGELALLGVSITVSGLTTNAALGTPVVDCAATPGTLTVNNAVSNTFAGTLANGTGLFSLAKSGAGILTISGANTFTGGLTINAGTLRLGSAGALNATAPNAVTFGASSTGTLALAGNSVTVSGLDTNVTVGTPVVQNTSAAPATLTANISGTSTFAGALVDGAGGGALSLTKSGAGSLILSGANTFSGTLAINGGTVTMSGGSLASTVVNQTTFVYNSGTFNGRLINAGTATFNADFAPGNGLENDVNMLISFGRTFTLGGLGLDNEGTLTLAGGTLNLSTSGSAANVNRGTLTISATLPLNLSGATLTNNGTLNLNGGLITSPTGSLVNGVGGTVSGTGTITSPFSSSGVVAVGSGMINITQPFANSGVIQLSSASSNLSGGTITNTGTIQGLGIVNSPIANTTGVIRASGGELDLGGAGNANATGAQIQAATGNTVFYVQGLTASAGTIALSGGAFDNNNHALSNTGIINGRGEVRTGGLTSTGTINVGGGDMNLFGPVTNNGTVNIQSSRSAYFYGNVNGTGTYTGTGTAVYLAGFSPGASPALISFGGGVDLAASSTLNIELGGTLPGSQFDRLHVTGQLSLGGSLAVSLIGGFSLVRGNSFDILDWNALSGTFSSLQLPVLVSPLRWNVGQLYADGTLSVVDSTRLPGDFNRDTQVTGADIPAMQQALTDLPGYEFHYNVSDSDLVVIGDFDGSGAFTNADMQGLLYLLSHGGIVLGSPSPAAPVPEPSSIAMIAVAQIATLFWARRRFVTTPI